MRISRRNKTIGMFMGIAIGDALGMPLETFSAEKIEKDYGFVKSYLTPDGHRWFNGQPAGTVTDDTILSLAVARGLIDSDGEPKMDTQVARHVEAIRDEPDCGWGKTTKNALIRMANGVPWDRAGKRSVGINGLGNGTAMKIAPAGILLANHHPKAEEFIVNLCEMTHQTSVGVSAGMAQAQAAAYCLATQPNKFSSIMFIQAVIHGSYIGKKHYTNTMKGFGKSNEDNLTQLLTDELPNFETNTPDVSRDKFGNGTSYAYNSIPFSLTFFLRDYTSLDALYNVANAGGDTDSNASMVGALLGALHGKDFWPDHLATGVPRMGEVVEVAENFCEVFGLHSSFSC